MTPEEVAASYDGALADADDDHEMDLDVRDPDSMDEP